MRPISSSSLCASSAVTSARSPRVRCSSSSGSVMKSVMMTLARGIAKLLVNGCRLRFGNELLKTWIIADRIPDGIDLQTRNGNELTGRSCDQLAKYFYCVLRPPGARFDFGQSGKKKRAGERIFFDW